MPSRSPCEPALWRLLPAPGLYAYMFVVRLFLSTSPFLSPGLYMRNQRHLGCSHERSACKTHLCSIVRCKLGPTTYDSRPQAFDPLQLIILMDGWLDGFRALIEKCLHGDPAGEKPLYNRVLFCFSFPLIMVDIRGKDQKEGGTCG